MSIVNSYYPETTREYPGIFARPGTLSTIGLRSI